MNKQESSLTPVFRLPLAAASCRTSVEILVDGIEEIFGRLLSFGLRSGNSLDFRLGSGLVLILPLQFVQGRVLGALAELQVDVLVLFAVLHECLAVVEADPVLLVFVGDCGRSCSVARLAFAVDQLVELTSCVEYLFFDILDRSFDSLDTTHGGGKKDQSRTLVCSVWRVVIAQWNIDVYCGAFQGRGLLEDCGSGTETLYT